MTGAHESPNYGDQTCGHLTGRVNKSNCNHSGQYNASYDSHVSDYESYDNVALGSEVMEITRLRSEVETFSAKRAQKTGIGIRKQLDATSPMTSHRWEDGELRPFHPTQAPRAEMMRTLKGNE